MIRELKIDNRVILNIKNISIKRKNKGLDYKNLRLFIIKRVINNIIYKLDLEYILILIFLVFHL